MTHLIHIKQYERYWSVPILIPVTEIVALMYLSGCLDRPILSSQYNWYGWYVRLYQSILTNNSQSSCYRPWQRVPAQTATGLLLFFLFLLSSSFSSFSFSSSSCSSSSSLPFPLLPLPLLFPHILTLLFLQLSFRTERGDYPNSCYELCKWIFFLWIVAPFVTNWISSLMTPLSVATNSSLEPYFHQTMRGNKSHNRQHCQMPSFWMLSILHA